MDTSPKNVCGWHPSTRKDVQGHQPLGTYNENPEDEHLLEGLKQSHGQHEVLTKMWTGWYKILAGVF